MTGVPLGVVATGARSAPERWRTIPIGWRLVVMAVGLLVAVELASSLVTGISGQAPAGNEASSSFGTDPDGLGAMSQLLSQNGHAVVRSVQPVGTLHLPAGATLFVVDPSTWTSAATATVSALIRSGGRVVVVGPAPGDGLLGAMFARPLPRWRPAASGPARPVGASPLTSGLQSVSSGSSGSLVPGSATVVLAGARVPFTVSNGSTRTGPPAVWAASSTPLTNGLLTSRDNAAFALDLAGPRGAPVVFDEYDHGYGRAGSGLAGLPPWWRTGLGVALLALVVWMLSASRRLGPVEPAARHLIPPRVAYVDALATDLGGRGRDRLDEALDPLRGEARRLLARRAGAGPGDDDASLFVAARRAGVPDEVLVGVLGGGSSDATGSATAPATATAKRTDAVAVGRAYSWLEAHRGTHG
jgi:hypothetical protein